MGHFGFLLKRRFTGIGGLYSYQAKKALGFAKDGGVEDDICDKVERWAFLYYWRISRNCRRRMCDESGNMLLFLILFMCLVI